MHIWKRMMACAAAAAIGFTAAMTAMAAGVNEATIDGSRTGSMTIYKYDLTTAQEDGVTQSYLSTGKANAEAEQAYAPYAVAGVEFSYLKVGTLQTRTRIDPTTGKGEVELVYGLNPAAVTAFSAIGITAADAEYEEGGLAYYLSDTLIDNLADSLADDSTSVKNALETFIKGNSGRMSGITDSNGRMKAENLELGLYLVVETAVPEDVTSTVNPFLVSLPMTDLEGDNWMYDVTLYPKNQTGSPTLTKEVAEVSYEEKDSTWEAKENEYADTATASDGDTLAYRITSELPVITSEATYLTTYTFVDTLSKGLTYKKGDVTLSWYAPDGTRAAVWSEGMTTKMFQATYTNGANGTEIMTVSMTKDGLAAINPAWSEYTVVIDYEVTVNSDATVVYGDLGNPNEVELTWERTNMDFEDTLRDDCLVYTYGLDLTKQFHSGSGEYSQVKFKLQNETDGFFVTAQKTADGLYYVMETVGAGEEEATVFSPDSQGSLKIYGLEDDIYLLTEVETAEGYVLLKEDIRIEIVSEEGLHSRTASAAVNGKAVSMLASGDSANALVPFTIVNERGFQIPMTGDNGLFLLPLMGMAAGSGLLVLLLASRGKRGNAQ